MPVRAVLLAAVLLAGCQSNSTPAAAAPPTQRQRDSAIGASGLPGARGVSGAQAAADSQQARNAQLDSLGKTP